MIPARINSGAERNVALKPQRRRRDEGNAAWIERAIATLKARHAVVLLGGTDLIHFRLRVAQGHARADLLPSFWSHAALHDAGAPTARRLVHVPPVPPLVSAAEVPSCNAVMEAPLRAFDDVVEFPNVAVLSFPLANGVSPAQEARRLKTARLAEDLVSPLVQWLAYVWGTAGSDNPLLAGHAMPAAALLEAAFGACGVDLTPGVAARAVCPEALWQAAVWWRDYYEHGGTGAPSKRHVPSGRYALDQERAAARQ